MNKQQKMMRQILAKLNEKIHVEHYNDGPAPKVNGLLEAATEIAALLAGEPEKKNESSARIITSFKDFQPKNEDNVPVVFVEPQQISDEEMQGIMSADLITDQPQLAVSAETAPASVTGVEPAELISDIVSDTPVDPAVGDVEAIQTQQPSFELEPTQPFVRHAGLDAMASCITPSHLTGTPFDPAIAPDLGATVEFGVPEIGAQQDPQEPITTQAQPHWWEESEALAGTMASMSETVGSVNYMALETIVSEHLFLQFIVAKREAQSDRSTALRDVYKNYIVGDKDLETRFAELEKLAGNLK